MISGIRFKALLLLAMLTSPVSAQDSASNAEIDALIAQLARPAPASIEFTELRFSSLLKNPLIVSGELGYEGPGRLERRVRTPYEEITAIRDDAVRVEREGERPRTFAVARAPELKGLLDSFTALLGGDSAQLRRQFELELERDAHAWRLELTPRDARVRRRVRAIVVTGAADEPRCVSILNPDSGASVITLGASPDALREPSVTREALQRYCAFDVERE